VVPALATADGSMADFIRLNDRFHDLIVACGKSAMIQRSLEGVLNLPFAGRRAFVDAPAPKLNDLHKTLIAGHAQHRDILDAIRNREGTRAQALTLEHAHRLKYLRLVSRFRTRRNNYPR
jgi:GntR family transcriptional regulator of vanillate catabolism